jgi:phosphoribosylglycinamide formyltransferase-1
LFKIAVLVSGGGTNLQSIIDAIEQKQLNAQIALVISSNHHAYALERAKKYNIETLVVSKKQYENPSNQILNATVNRHIDLIVLAGYLGILKGDLLKTYKNKIINIHPALLPKFGGPGMYGHYIHEAVISAKETESGCTVHFVNEAVDEGKIILQEKVKVLSNDTPKTLAARILLIEHKLLPKAIALLANKTNNSIQN